MKIQAINPVMRAESCQPIKPEFSGKKRVKKKEIPDNFIKQDPYTSEQKYEMACRLAAYYKTQYENLVKGKVCLA